MGSQLANCPHCNAPLALSSSQAGNTACPACGKPLPAAAASGGTSRKLLWLIPLVLLAVMAAGFVVYLRMGTPLQQDEAVRANFEKSFLESCIKSAGGTQEQTAETTAQVQRYCQCSLDEFNQTLTAKQWSLVDLLPDMQGDLSGNPELKAELTRITEICAKRVKPQQ
ncbi:hypothetical protein [Oleomonas cavernae]|uniref:hypothetical protein n=1 Tax=Oleomonas cavernae TaxID=2320859 RepID=UPI000E6C50EE|nr:hypothetical protein [Oleomonas cavernae]